MAAAPQFGLTDPETVAHYMSLARSVEDWGRRYQQVKNAHGGEQPDWWHERIIQGGALLAAKMMWW